MKVTIGKSRAIGKLQAPPSKSMAHRLMIGAALCKGKSVIHGISDSQDMLATIDCITGLGAKVERNGMDAIIDGTDYLKNIADGVNICTRESGSTLRFMIPMCLMCGSSITLSGSARLMERPLSVYEDICKEQGLFFERADGQITVSGKLSSADYQIPGDISSQFITGLLFVLPLLDKDSRIILTGAVESRSYINMTIMSLSYYGVNVSWENDHILKIFGGQSYNPGELTVEGDYSNAAFLDAFDVIGGDVSVDNLLEDSLQGDKIYKQYFKSIMDGNCQLDIKDCPDLGPILMALMAAKNGGTLTGTRRLKIKESDRGQAMKDELIKIGCDIRVDEDTITIPCVELKKPTEDIDSHNDHRIVMSMAILLTLTGGTISGAEAVRKSYPDFFDNIKTLSVEVKIEDGQE